MLYNLLALLASATLASAATPAGFQPASNTELVVSFNGQTQQNGVVAVRDCTFLRPPSTRVSPFSSQHKTNLICE